MIGSVILRCVCRVWWCVVHILCSPFPCAHHMRSLRLILECFRRGGMLEFGLLGVVGGWCRSAARVC